MVRHTRRSAAAAAAAAAAAEAEKPGAAESAAVAEPAAAAEPAAKRAKKEDDGEDGLQFKAGERIPEGEVVNQEGKPVNLAKEFASGLVALFAYPKASTPGCSRQTIGFGGVHAELTQLGVTVFGISADSPAAQTTFKKKSGVDFDLLSDPQYKLLGPLGAKKNPKGTIRSHWVFSNGVAELVEHQVKPDSSPQHVLQFVKQLTGSISDFENPADPDEKRLARESADAPPPSAKRLAKEPLQKLSDGAEAEQELSDEPTAHANGTQAQEDAAASKTEEPKTEEPKTEEPKTEEPKTETNKDEPEVAKTEVTKSEENAQAGGEPHEG